MRERDEKKRDDKIKNAGDQKSLVANAIKN